MKVMIFHSYVTVYQFTRGYTGDFQNFWVPRPNHPKLDHNSVTFPVLGIRHFISKSPYDLIVYLRSDSISQIVIDYIQLIHVLLDKMFDYTNIIAGICITIPRSNHLISYVYVMISYSNVNVGPSAYNFLYVIYQILCSIHAHRIPEAFPLFHP